MHVTVEGPNVPGVLLQQAHVRLAHQAVHSLSGTQAVFAPARDETSLDLPEYQRPKQSQLSEALELGAVNAPGTWFIMAAMSKVALILIWVCALRVSLVPCI